MDGMPLWLFFVLSFLSAGSGAFAGWQLSIWFGNRYE